MRDLNRATISNKAPPDWTFPGYLLPIDTDRKTYPPQIDDALPMVRFELSRMLNSERLFGGKVFSQYEADRLWLIFPGSSTDSALKSWQYLENYLAPLLGIDCVAINGTLDGSAEIVEALETIDRGIPLYVYTPTKRPRRGERIVPTVVRPTR